MEVMLILVLNMGRQRLESKVAEADLLEPFGKEAHQEHRQPHYDVEPVLLLGPVGLADRAR